MFGYIKKSKHLLWSAGLLGFFAAIFLPSWITDNSSLRFESPWFLLWLLAVPFVAAMGMLEKRYRSALKYPMLSTLKKTGCGWRHHLVPVRTGLKVAAVALLAVALARPQDSSRREETELNGIDIVLVMDVSLSMKAADLEPTRLDAMKAVVLDFVKRRKNDRIGAVIFGKNAYTLCPLTLDYSVLSSMIYKIKLGVISGDATAIGNAVGVALNRLRKSDAKSKTVILLTDGTSNAGNISPEQASKFAKTLGIKIYTVLMGEKENAKVSVGMDFFKQQIFGTTKSPINRELLVEMSENTGGAFFDAADKKGLFSSFHKILDTLEKSKIADRGIMYAEIFNVYLFSALLLLILDFFLGAVVVRRTP